MNSRIKIISYLLALLTLLGIFSFLMGCIGEKSNPSYNLKNSKWELIFLNGEKPISGSTITAYFDKENQGSVSGNAGVNSYGGQYQTSSPNKLIIYDLKWTLIGGSADLMKQEQAYMQYLQNAASFTVFDNRLEIFDDQQNKVLVFERRS